MINLRIISRCRSRSSEKRCAIGLYILHHLKSQHFCTSTLKKFEKLNEEEFFNKVIYNEVLKKSKKHCQEKIPQKMGPICLRYLMPQNNETENVNAKDVETEKVFHFPYEVNQNDEIIDSVDSEFSETVKNFTPSDNEEIEVPQWKAENLKVHIRNVEKPRRWALEDETLANNNEFEEVLRFGSVNPNAPITSIPCGGCGALLHCNDPKMPGFIPAELFESKSKKELLGEKCQRCYFLSECGVSLGVNVSPLEYKKIISTIKDKDALAIIMIDILDFPCSVFPGIFDLIGLTKPVVIVANKVDLLIQEGPWCLKNFKQSLVWSLKKQRVNLNNLKHIDLISAKTGYGIERFIDLLHSNWGNKGDIYLIGCTNVGKSSLFNALIQSDFCKVKAVNLMQRATISAWPGTTLNLLRFPIMKRSKWHTVLRSRRLSAQIKEELAFKNFQCLGQNISLEQIPLQEYVGRTFCEAQDLLESPESNNTSNDSKQKGFNPHELDFARGYWFYDTPGVVHQDQIINFLTASELLLTVPKKMLLPRNFYLEPGNSLFIAGLARLDYIKGASPVWFTVYASMELPLTVTKLEDAEYVYQRFLGTPYFRVPENGKKRLAKWPSLMSKKFEIVGNFSKYIPSRYKLNEEKIPKDADVDIVLSSAGWISVNVSPSYRCKVEAWTPQGRGIHLRDIPLIKKGYTFRGPRIPGTPAFKTVMKELRYVIRKGIVKPDKAEFPLKGPKDTFDYD